MILRQHLGKFLDENGDVVKTEPNATDAFPIRCGDWPNEHEHAIRKSCSICGVYVGISPKGLSLHERLPELRPLFCGACFEILTELLKVMHDGVRTQ